MTIKTTYKNEVFAISSVDTPSSTAGAVIQFGSPVVDGLIIPYDSKIPTRANGRNTIIEVSSVEQRRTSTVLTTATPHGVQITGQKVAMGFDPGSPFDAADSADTTFIGITNVMKIFDDSTLLVRNQQGLDLSNVNMIEYPITRAAMGVSFHDLVLDVTVPVSVAVLFTDSPSSGETLDQRIANREVFFNQTMGEETRINMNGARVSIPILYPRDETLQKTLLLAFYSMGDSSADPLTGSIATQIHTTLDDDLPV